MTKPLGRYLELLYIDGRPDGMVTAELSNWTGHVLMVPRTQLVDALKRSEPKCTGAYLLLGEQNGDSMAYIGESEVVGDRVKSHAKNKDWWTSVVFITSAGNKLNKAHVRYMEARLFAEAKKIGRMPLENAAVPPAPSLSEADIAKMEAFLSDLFIVLPAVRVDMFIERTRKVILPAIANAGCGSSTEVSGANFVLKSKKHGLHAQAIFQDGEFIVKAGSTARLNWESKVTGYTYSVLYEELKRSGVIQVEGDHCVFTQNYVFQSPSAAAAVVTGRPAAGTVEWKLDPGGQTYKQWELDCLAAADLELVG